MVRLSEMHRLIGNYLELHGDKDITSISTTNGSNIKYTLHLHDIHEGPVGTNPYTGSDQINIPKQDPDANNKKIAGEMIKMMFKSHECY